MLTNCVIGLRMTNLGKTNWGRGRAHEPSDWVTASGGDGDGWERPAWNVAEMVLHQMDGFALKGCAWVDAFVCAKNPPQDGLLSSNSLCCLSLDEVCGRIHDGR